MHAGTIETQAFLFIEELLLLRRKAAGGVIARHREQPADEPVGASVKERNARLAHRAERYAARAPISAIEHALITIKAAAGLTGRSGAATGAAAVAARFGIRRKEADRLAARVASAKRDLTTHPAGAAREIAKSAAGFARRSAKRSAGVNDGLILTVFGQRDTRRE